MKEELLTSYPVKFKEKEIEQLFLEEEGLDEDSFK
jgi:hypothetical protein